jgi:hypothetical protein
LLNVDSIPQAVWHNRNTTKGFMSPINSRLFISHLQGDQPIIS